MNSFRFSFPCLPFILAMLLPAMVDRLSAQSASAPPYSNEAMLKNIAQAVIVPAYEQLAVKCRELTNSVGELAKVPDQKSLDNARQSWAAAALAANRVRCFQAGPLSDRGYDSTFFFGRPFPKAIEEILASSRPIDPKLIEDLGITTKGMFAVEYLLFGQKLEPTGQTNQSTLKLLAGSDAQRRLQFLVAIAQDIEAKAGLAAKDWRASAPQGATAKFVSEGQASVNVLVNQLAKALEDMTEHQLHFVLGLPKPLSAQLGRIPNSPSGTSLENLRACLDGVRKTYAGADGLGLDDALIPVNPNLRKKLDEQFAAAIVAVNALALPLEQAIVNDRASVQNAYEKMRILEILFKVDLTSALGVTLTFNSTDGD